VNKRQISPAMIALVAVLIALTTVITRVVQIPTLARGYANFSDVAITFTGLVFGPWVGLVVGGVGTALADLTSGFVPFAPLSFIAHGLEGFLIGWLGRGRRTVGGMIVAWLVGSLAMITVYLVGETLFYRVLNPEASSFSAAWVIALTEVPVNAFQALIGGLVGIPLVLAVRKAYPPIDRLGQRSQWTEE
jgi:uncharacterized membrane protein